MIALPDRPHAPPSAAAPRHGRGATLRAWFDTSAVSFDPDDPLADRVDWSRILPFVLLHVGCLGVFLVGWSWVAVGTCAALYLARMFAITAFYHRYFAHRAFRTSRLLQFLFAFLGNTSAQRGPLWWAAHHRKHHKFSDTPRDVHSPTRQGLWWSHVFWFTTRRNFATDVGHIRDFARFAELRFLDRFDVLAPATLAVAMVGLGAALARWAPALGTDGWQMLVWGFFVSTTLLFHGTSTINSLGHLFGRRRYPTKDTSRNSFLLALLTLGEGWHNNHHHYPVSVRQGFFWWEVDLTWYGLKAMSWLGLVWDLRPIPAHVRAGRKSAAHDAA